MENGVTPGEFFADLRERVNTREGSKAFLDQVWVNALRRRFEHMTWGVKASKLISVTQQAFDDNTIGLSFPEFCDALTKGRRATTGTQLVGAMVALFGKGNSDELSMLAIVTGEAIASYWETFCQEQADKAVAAQAAQSIALMSFVEASASV